MPIYKNQYKELQMKRPKGRGLFGAAFSPMTQTTIPQEMEEAKIPDISEPPAENKSFFSRVKDSFSTKDEPRVLTTKSDELGVQKPISEKAGAGRKVLDYLLPSVLGMVGGVGVIPGLMSGLKKTDERNKTNREAEQKYGENRMAMMGKLLDVNKKRERSPTSYEVLSAEYKAAKRRAISAFKSKRDPDPVDVGIINRFEGVKEREDDEQDDPYSGDVVNQEPQKKGWLKRLFE